MKSLNNERSGVLVNLITVTERIREEFESRTGQSLDPESGMENIPTSHNFSKVLNAIIWARQLIGKIKKLQNISSGILGDLQEFGAFNDFCDQLTNIMTEYESEQFESWKNDLVHVLKQPDNELSL